jgi:hypothetical protein
MCWALYLASNEILPSVPWIDDAPGFNNQQLERREQSVKKQFTLNNVIYLGSHTGCGCGFSEANPDDPQDVELRSKTMHVLADYLSELLARGIQLQMFFCWEGGEGEQTSGRKVLHPQDFLAPRFPLAEREFANVT